MAKLSPRLASRDPGSHAASTRAPCPAAKSGCEAINQDPADLPEILAIRAHGTRLFKDCMGCWPKVPRDREHDCLPTWGFVVRNGSSRRLERARGRSDSAAAADWWLGPAQRLSGHRDSAEAGEPRRAIASTLASGLTLSCLRPGISSSDAGEVVSQLPGRKTGQRTPVKGSADEA